MDDYDNQPVSTAKKSRKTLWIVIIVLLLIAAAVAAYSLIKNNNDKNSTAANNTVSNSTSQPPSTTSTFTPASTAGVPYIATITTGAGNAVLSSDGKGNSSYVITKDGTETKLIYTADAYYLCSGTATCIKYPASKTASSGFDPSTYQYDSARLDALKTSAAYKGTQACPSGGGTCEVWSTTYNGVTSTLYINKSNHRISEVKTIVNGQNSTVVYEYKSVTITPPANATTVPTQ